MRPLTSAEIDLMEAFALDFSTPLHPKAPKPGLPRLRRETALRVKDVNRPDSSTVREKTLS
jgi:hypothetical protein